MRHVRRITIIDQTAQHIRDGVQNGRWTGKLPGLRPLAEELGVSRESLRTALRRLEAEGLLAAGEQGDSRRIVGTVNPGKRETLRIALMPARHMENESVADQSIILSLMHDLEAAGHDCMLVAPPGHSADPGVAAVQRLVAEKNADAWIVYQGSRDVLKWFSEQATPTLAIGGHNSGLPLASVGFNYAGAVSEATRRLVALGHRRIVFISPSFARRPAPSRPVRAFLDELSAAGITTGEFNSPDWEESPAGLRTLMESLFMLTPPTAIITWDGYEASGVLSFLNERKLSVPGDISLVALTTDASIAWQNPKIRIATLDQESSSLLRHCIRWADGIVAGAKDTHAELLAAEFLPGNTLGPPAKR